MKTKLFFALVFFFAVTNGVITLAQTDIKQTIEKYNIDNCVNEFNPAKVESTKVGFQYWFADKNFADGKTVKLSVVAPHSATHPPHKHAEDEFFFVLEGTAQFYLNGKTKIVGPMTSLYCPSDVEHGISNVGDSVLKYLVIKKYIKN